MGSTDHSQGTPPKLSALVVEDEPLVARVWKRLMLKIDFEVSVAPSVEAALLHLEEARFHLVLLDYRLPDGFADEIVDVLDEMRPRPLVVLITGYVEQCLSLAGRVSALIPKPVEGEIFLTLAGTLRDRILHNPIERFCTRNRLSRREVEVVLGAIDGQEPVETAHQIGCAEATVRSYWRRIFEKTGLRSQRDVLAAILRDTLGPVSTKL